ncbi:hypothetical protein [Streptomyces sp. NPDC057623]|uniref:hypothetical protein n=1 Tax=Streptomyces sp. NPDC057623 TaxID=3346187 RepID=UPI00369F1D5A
MPATILTTTRIITGDCIRIDDVISVGGIPHAVADMRDVSPHCKRLQFQDGNVYFLPRSTAIEVTRVAMPRRIAMPIRRTVTTPRIAHAAQDSRTPLDAAGAIRANAD